MVKVVAAVNKLKKHGLPFISILADPSTGGAIASYAALGDVIIAEPGALIIFTGPRVMKSRGFEVDEKRVRSEHLHEISKKIYEKVDYFHDVRGIQEISQRKDMKYTVTKYLEFYSRTKGPVIKIKRSKARMLFF
jgi:acetyl-CoA carboxylase beta subunit